MLGTLRDARTRHRRRTVGAVLRDDGQPRYLRMRGWTAITIAPHAVEEPTRRAGIRRRRVGALRARRLDPVARPRRRNPKKLAELQRLWLIEADRYNVVPLDDRGFEHHRPASPGVATDTWQHTVAVPGHAGQRVGCSDAQEQVALGDRQHRGARIGRHWRDRHSRRQRWRMVAARASRDAEVLLQLLRYRALHRHGGQADTSRQTSGADGIRL